MATWLARLEAADIPCGPINDIAQVLADPQVRARNMVVPVDDDRLDGFAVAGNPIKLSAFPDRDPSRPGSGSGCVTAWTPSATRFEWSANIAP